MSHTISSKAGNVRFGIILGILLAVAVIFFQKEWNIAMYIASGLALALLSLKVFFTLKALRKKREHEAYLVRRAEQEQRDLQNRQKQEQDEKNHRVLMLEKIPGVLDRLKVFPLKNWNDINNFMTDNNYYSFIKLMYSHESEEYRKQARSLYEIVKQSKFDAEFLDVIQISDTKKQLVFNGHVVRYVRQQLRDLINSIHDDQTLQQLYRQYKNLQEALKGKSDYRGYKELYESITYHENADIIEILCNNNIVFEPPAK